MLQGLAVGALEGLHFGDYLDGLIGLMRLDGLVTLRIADVKIEFILRLKGDLVIELHVALVHLVILEQAGEELGGERAIDLGEVV